MDNIGFIISSDKEVKSFESALTVDGKKYEADEKVTEPTTTASSTESTTETKKDEPTEAPTAAPAVKPTTGTPVANHGKLSVK